jgi:signal transduction histidine kinase
LLGTIAEAAASAATVPDVLRVAVEEICRFLKWPVGHAFAPSPTSARELVSTGIWHLDGAERFASFRRASGIFPDIQQGLIGRAVAARKAIHVADISDKAVDFLYLDKAREGGLTSGLVMPVMAGEGVIEVLEFYSTRRVEPDAVLLAALDQVARHIGQIAERIRARVDQLGLSEAIDGIGDSIALFDKDERLVLYNRNYAESLPLIADMLKPGMAFESGMRALAKRGYYGPVDEGWIAERLRRFRKRENLEYLALQPDGSRQWNELRHLPARNGGTLLIRSDITERKRAEAELEFSRGLLQTALDSMVDGAALFDRDERLVLFNANFVKRHNLISGLIKPGMTFTELVEAQFKRGAYVDADKDMASRRVRDFRALKAAELHLNDPDGGDRWVLINFYRTRDGGTFLVRADITERKRAETELESSRQLLRSALDSITDGVALFDKDERLVLFNDSYAQRLKMPPDFLQPGVTFPAIVEKLMAHGAYLGVDREWADERMRKFRALEPVEMHMSDPDGRDHWYNVHLYRTRDGGTLLVRSDITESKRTEEQLKSTQGLLLTALESMIDGIALFDKNERLVLYNQEFLRFPAMMRDIVKPGLTFTGLVEYLMAHGGYPGRDRAWIDDRVRRFRALETIEVNFRDADENDHWFNISHHRTRDGGILLVRNDITVRMRALGEIARARTIAEDANEVKTKFLASMSHELRTPLNAVLGFAQMIDLGMGKLPEAQTREYVTIILKSGQHLLDLVNQILEFAKIETQGDRKTFVALLPADLARQCLGMVSEEAMRRDVSIVDRAGDAGADARFLGDAVWVRQILLNLLVNAIKYNRPGGTATVTAARRANGMVRFAVADTGLGIAPEMRDRVFQPFQRLGREAGQIEGAGIGLALSRQLVMRMGGDIGFASEPGKGSTFWFDLPAAKNEVERVA